MKGFMNGLIVGALIGGVVALLFAPRKGAETQAILKEKIKRAKAEIERRKKELEEMQARIKEEAGGVAE